MKSYCLSLHTVLLQAFAVTQVNMQVSKLGRWAGGVSLVWDIYLFVLQIFIACFTSAWHCFGA